MKKITLIFLISATLFACEQTAEQVKTEIAILKDIKNKLQEDNNKLSNHLDSLRNLNLSLEEKSKTLKIYASGRTPKYIVKFKLKQSHFSLDVGEHIKDAANAIDFEMPVDKEYYESLSEGQNIVSDFRIGSAIINGSFGDWKVSVKSKRIE